MDRLVLLKEKKIIDNQEYKILKNIELEMKNFNEQKRERFLTHTAMALFRIKNGQKIDKLSKYILTEIKSNQFFRAASKLINNWFQELKYQLPENEKWYLFMHVIDYLEEKYENSSGRSA